MLLITESSNLLPVDTKLYEILKFELPYANEKIKSQNSECFITLSYERYNESDKTSITAILFKISCSYCKKESIHKIKRNELIAKKNVKKTTCYNYYCKHCPQINQYDTRFMSNNRFTILRTKRTRVKKFPEKRKPFLEKDISSIKKFIVRKRKGFSRSQIIEKEISDSRDIIEEIEAFAILIDDISHDNVLRYAKEMKNKWFNIIKLREEMKSSRLYIKYKTIFTFERDIVQGQLEDSLQYLSNKKYLESRVSNNTTLFRITKYGLKKSRYLDIIDLYLNYQEGQYINDSKVLRIDINITPHDILQYLKSVLRGKRSKKIIIAQIESKLKLADQFKTLATKKRSSIIDFLRKCNTSNENILENFEKKIKAVYDEYLTSMIKSSIIKLQEEKYIKPIGKAFKLTSRLQWVIIYIKKLLKGNLPFYFKLFGCFSLLVILTTLLLVISS